MTNQNKAKTRDELIVKAANEQALTRVWKHGKSPCLPPDEEYVDETIKFHFISGAKWADQNPSPEVQGLLGALSRIKTLTYSWVIAEQTKDCRHTYNEIKYQVDNALETYRKTVSKE